MVGEHADEHLRLRDPTSGAWRPEDVPAEFEKCADEAPKSAGKDGGSLMTHGGAGSGEKLFKQANLLLESSFLDLASYREQ